MTPLAIVTWQTGKHGLYLRSPRSTVGKGYILTFWPKKSLACRDQASEVSFCD